MSKLHDEHFGFPRRAFAFETFYKPRAPASVVSVKDALYRIAADKIGRDGPVTYLEFGVANGDSLRKMALEFNHPDSLFVGFDSFLGLPEQWMQLSRGAFSRDGVPPGIDDSRVRLVQGWFQNTLHENLAWLEPGFSNPVLIHFDADLYSSTLFLLTSLWPRCREYHFIMDDFMMDDIVALHDFSLAYPVKIELFAAYEGDVPYAVLGKITRTRFETETASGLEQAAENPEQALAHADQLAADGDLDAALAIWAALRDTPSPAGGAWLAPARALRERLRFDEADALLADARSRFPDDPTLLMEWAALPFFRRDFQVAESRLEIACRTLPDNPACPTFRAAALRELGRLDDAALLLASARERFPEDAGIAIEHGMIAQSRGDWPEALRRWQGVRNRFPDLPRPYINGAMALRESRRYDEADALLEEARARFPNDLETAIEFARVPQVQRNWSEAARRWGTVVERFPGHVVGYVGAAAALRELGEFQRAGAILVVAQKEFPGDPEAAVQYATLASSRREWNEALRRWQSIVERFPDHPAGFAAMGSALRELRRLDEAESFLADARRRFPADPGIAIEYAHIAHIRRDWPEALRRWEAARATAPHHPAPYGWASHAQRAIGRTAEAEALLREGIAALPHEVSLALDLARLVEDKGVSRDTEQCWRDVAARFPDSAEAVAGVASAYRRQGRLDEAEHLIDAAIARMPGAAALAEQHGLNASAREDWPEALTRLEAAQKRFPGNPGVRQALYEVTMRIAESGNAPAPRPMGETTDADRDLVMNFESLGGGGHGCEFGIFQRAMGAEPLGLLRWADLDHHRLIAALNNDFEGVGEPEFTRVFVPPHEGRQQYWTTDTRYHMAMNSFVSVDEVPEERMSRLVSQRMRFLRAKLIDDLRSGQKLFVYKNLKRNLTDDEIATLQAAMRRYGDNTLFYIQYEDQEHPNGTVEKRSPSLLVGYIDHFSHTADTDQLIAPAHEQFLALCRQAYAVWRG